MSIEKYFFKKSVVASSPAAPAPATSSPAAPSPAKAQDKENDDSGSVLDKETGLILPGDIKVAYEIRANTDVGPVRSLQDSVRATAKVLGLETQASTYRDLALGLITPSGLKNKLVAFINAPHALPDKSLVPVDAFLGKPNRGDWDTHCVTVKESWQLFCAKVDSISGGQIELKHMAAPSGPARSKVAMLWHYPTFTSGNSVYSHVMDPDSPSLWAQQKKMGLDDGIKTLDMFPFRLDYNHDNGPEWEKRFENWPALREACLEHVKEIIKDDRLLVVVGDEIWQETKWLVKSRRWTLTYVELQVDIKMFSAKPRIYLAQDFQGRVQQVLIRIWHGQYVYHNSHEERGAIWDLMWNTACEIAGVEIKNPELLTWAATHFLRSSSQDPEVAQTRPGSYTVFMNLRRRQNAEGRLLSAEEIRQYLPALFSRFPELGDLLQQASDKGHAALSAVEQHFNQKSVQTRQDRKNKREAESPAVAPPAKRVATDVKKIEAAGASAAARKTMQDAEAHRQSPDKTLEQSRTLERIDRLKEFRDISGKKFSAELGSFVVFYHPKKYPRGLRFLPEHGADPYAGKHHPAVIIGQSTRLLNAMERHNLAGPVE
ncbi:hypothetical protein FPCIR_2980 [Fusarium pseudocircinatum]|uniref:Uncharacterized protein n=1 Tax=Fusarium pseudocircinatum TaxID=56676 RepID=A0A8H5PL20_9HYPO|nr:hypothetical protein FPCIR_2980 [Fusarium pseudocircinatum]